MASSVLFSVVVALSREWTANNLRDGTSKRIGWNRRLVALNSKTIRISLSFLLYLGLKFGSLMRHFLIKSF